jgi:hypothetical protein
VAELGQQHIEVFGTEVGEPEYRRGPVNEIAGGEGVLRQPRLEGGIAVETAAGIQQELGGAAQQEAEAGGALQAVVEDAQELLVVGIARLGVVELVEVDDSSRQTSRPS